MKRIAGLVLPALVLALTGCNARGGDAESHASGRNGGKDYQVAAFDRVELKGAQDVIVTVGGTQSVRAEGDTGLIERLEISVEDGVLHVGHKKGSWSFGWSKDKAPVTVHVTVPVLRGAAIAGSGDLRVDKVQAETFAGSIAGSGDLEIASLTAKAAQFSIAGNGAVTAAGTAETASFTIAGNGDVRAGGLALKRAKVSIAGSGNVEARATESADVEIMGSGDVSIAGGAKCNVSKMGSGDVRCGA